MPEDDQVVLVRHAHGVTEFLGFNRRRWVNEYPDAARMTFKEARDLCAHFGEGGVVEHYGMNNEHVAYGDIYNIKEAGHG